MNALHLVHQEVERQKAAGYQLETWPSLPCPVDFTAIEENQPFYLPKLDVAFSNSIVVSNEADFREVLDAVETVSGVPNEAKDYTIRHESQHADTLRQFNPRNIRTLIHLTVGRVGLIGLGTPEVRAVSPFIIAEPAVITEDVRITKLGMAMVLAAPDRPSDADEQNIQKLGYADPSEVKRRARQYPALYPFAQ